MNNKVIFLILLVMAVSAPAQAITTTLNPTLAIANSVNDAYTATLNPTGGPSGGFFFLNITIPRGYTFVLPASGSAVGNYSMLNVSTGTNKVIINITSATNDPNGNLVNVIYSTDYGNTYKSRSSLDISNMSIGASTLHIIKPTASKAGYMNISLDGSSGPIDPAKNVVTISLAKGTLRNPKTPGLYTWYLEAKNSPTGMAFTSSNVVNVVMPILSISSGTKFVKIGIPTKVLFTVTTNNKIPVPDANVNITQRGVEIASGTTNASGQAMISVRALRFGVVRVVASKMYFMNATTVIIATRPFS